MWNFEVQMRIHSVGNLTLLCYERPRSQIEWADVDVDGRYNTSWNPLTRTIVEYPDGSEIGLYYEVYCSGRGTDGQWGMQTGTISGKPVFSYHFPQQIFLSSIEFNITSEDVNKIVEITNNDPYYSTVQDWWGQHAIYSAIATKLGIEMRNIGIRGYILDKNSDQGLMDLMRGFLDWLYVILAEFAGRAWSFAEDVWLMVSEMIYNMRYLVAPIMLMAMLTVSSKTVMKAHPRDPKEEGT